jgi:hypothetical protein
LRILIRHQKFYFLFAATRRSSEDSPKADALIDSIIALVEQAPPLSLEAIERSITNSDAMVLLCVVFRLHEQA